jgi:pimeloyl-ACP methyl ester carboxylesterase
VHQRAPFFTWANTWFNAPCLDWPAPSSTPVEVDGTGFAAPVLLLSETRDSATPYSGALRVRELFPSSALVAGVGGTSHAVSLFGIACTDDTIADVLRDGSLPSRKPGDRADKECKPVAPPQPSDSQRPIRQRPLLVAHRPLG